MKLKYNTKLLVALKGFCSVRSETRARKGEKEWGREGEKGFDRSTEREHE